jgi:hypothetical protein
MSLSLSPFGLTVPGIQQRVPVSKGALMAEAREAVAAGNEGDVDFEE